MSYASEVLADSPLAYYTFDADSPTTSATDTNLLLDSSGNANHGDYVNAASATDYAGAAPLIPDSTGGSFIASDAGYAVADTAVTWTTNFTVEFTFVWVAGTALLRDNTSASGQIFGLDNSGTFAVRVATNLTVNTSKTTAQVRDGNKHLLTVVKSGANLTIYLDGTSIGTSASAANTAPTTAIRIGKNGSTTPVSEAVLDDVVFYNTALSSGRVTAHYNAWNVSDPAQPATSFVAAGTVASSAVSTTLSPGIPTGTTTDDVMLAVASFTGNTALTWPGGWTVIDSTNMSASRRSEIAWKRAGASESAPTISGFPGTNAAIVQIYTFRSRLSSATPVYANGKNQPTQNTLLKAPSLTPPNTLGHELVLLGAIAVAAQPTYTPGHTPVLTSRGGGTIAGGNGAGIVCFSGAAGSTTPTKYRAVSPNSNATNVVYAILLAPEIKNGAAALTGTGSLSATAAAGSTVDGAAAISGTGSLTATGAASATGSATASGTGSLTATGAARADGAASASGTGTLAATGDASASGAASIAGSGSLTASGTATAAGDASLSGAGSLSATASAEATGSASLSGVGSLSATGETEGGGTVDGAASLTAIGAILAIGDASTEGAATVTGTGSLVAVGAARANGSAALSGSGSLAGAGHLIFPPSRTGFERASPHPGWSQKVG